jgi:hypothetical protein
MAIVKDFRWKPAQSTGLPWLRAQFLATAGVTGTALRFQWERVGLPSAALLARDEERKASCELLKHNRPLSGMLNSAPTAHAASGIGCP